MVLLFINRNNGVLVLFDFFEQIISWISFHKAFEIFFAFIKIFLKMTLSVCPQKVNYVDAVIFKSNFFIFHVSLVFGLVNCLHNWYLIFMNFLMPFVTQGFNFYFSLLFVTSFTGALLPDTLWQSLRNISKTKFTAVFQFQNVNQLHQYLS